MGPVGDLAKGRMIGRQREVMRLRDIGRAGIGVSQTKRAKR